MASTEGDFILCDPTFLLLDIWPRKINPHTQQMNFLEYSGQYYQYKIKVGNYPKYINNRMDRLWYIHKTEVSTRMQMEDLQL